MKGLYSILLVIGSTILACKTSPIETTSFKDVSAEHIRKLSKEREVVFIDVRTPGETASGMIEGASQLDFRDSTFVSKLDGLDRNATYIVYCAKGSRSSQAMQIMKQMGFAEVYNLSGGYHQWISEEEK